GDGGADDLRYPDDVPLGYFNPAQISLDSVAAFTVAEGEARRAKMAFDSCDYLLRLREYSNEPVWRLSLLDASRRLVGKLYVSASSGRVLRTIWIYRDQRARPDGMPLIIDSLAPTGDGPSLDLSQSDYTGLDNSVIGGVTSVPAVPGRVPGQVPGTMSGIHSVPLPPAPGMPVAGNPAVGAQPQPYYAPVDPSGRVMTAPDDGIPVPPPVSSNVPGMAPSTAPIPAPPVPAPPQAPTVAPAPAPAPAPAATPKPPVTSPSGGGDSERIPPPPVPR
ncbi:MAG TPA: hypothetical protein PLA50_20155, partial [Bacteroidia bacterium]|nr:hypothetical protein [Bacteroidia bacterium]